LGLPNKKRISYVPWLNPLITVDKSFDIVKGFLYNNMEDEEIVSIIAKNVSNQLYSYFESFNIVKN
jgi:hypothetical protein